MILVSHLRDFTKPEATERRRVEWGIGCTARELAPEWAEPDDPLVGCARNGGLVTDWDALLADGDHIHYWARPGFQVVVGSAFLATFLNTLQISVALGLLSRLISPSRKPVEPGDESSATYGFTNLQRNLRGDGVPIPVIYHRHRIAPPIVNEYIRSSIDSQGNPLSEYVALLLLGEGPIHAIGDKTEDGGPFSQAAGNPLQTLQINNQPAENFEGVEAHVRLGNLDQTAIAEFADPVLTFDVGLTMRDSETLTHATTPTDIPGAGTAIAQHAPTSWSPAVANVTKWDNFETYTSGDDADEFTVIFNLPQGLISYSSLGNPASNNVIYQIRYRQVDGGGTPFGNYVILPAEQATLTRRGALKLESRHRFYDPVGYFAPLPGLYVQSRALAQGNPGVSYTISPSFPVPATVSSGFTFSTWLRRRNAQAASTTNRLFGWTGTNTGFRCNLVADASGSAVAFLIGNGSSFTTLNLAGTAGTTGPDLKNDTTDFHHFVITYEADFDGNGLGRARFYFDGVLRGTVTTAVDAVWAPTQQIRLMSDSETVPTAGYDGHLDETTFWSKAWTGYEVASFWNGGAPIGIDAAAPGLIIGARFDSNDGTTPNIGSEAFGPYVNAPDWRFGTGTNAATDPNLSASAGPVQTPEGGTKLRGKFLVEVMRLDSEDTSGLSFSEIEFNAIQLRTFQQYEYPGMALLAVKVPATDQLSGDAPLLTVIAEGRLVPVWDGNNPVYPNMVATYSGNPAWVAADALLNRDFGLGAVYTAKDLDVAQFQVFADFCDELIYDNGTRKVPITARALESADGANPTGEDCIRYRFTSLPSNFPQVSVEDTGKQLIVTTASPSPAVPSWLSDEIADGPHEAIRVDFDAGTNDFYVYCRSNNAIAATSALLTPISGYLVEVRDVRARFDGIFDRSDFPAWDAVLQIMQSARASPMRIGSRVSVFVDDVASPVALVGMGNIIEGSWRSGFQGIADRPNAESTEFLDEDLNYERTPEADEHPSVTDPANQSSFIWRRVKFEGITRRGQAKRFLRRDLNTFFLVRRWCEFELGLDSLPLLPGDVLAVSHDVVGFGISGRIHSDATNTTVRLDRSVTISGGSSYQVQVEDAATGARQTRAVTQGAGTYAAGSAITVAAFASSYAPASDDKYAFGEVTAGETKLYRMVESTFDPHTLRLKVRCLEYDPQVYDDDFGELPTVNPSSIPAPSVPQVPPGVQNLQVEETTTRGPDGHVSIGMEVSFDHFPETFHSVGGTDVYVSAGDHTSGRQSAQLVQRLDAGSTSFLLTGYPFARNQTYTVWVVPRTISGASAYRSFASWIEVTPNGLAAPPSAPTNLRGIVSGEEVVYLWDDPGDLDQSAVVEARRGGWILGLSVFTAPAQARHFGPFADWAGGPANAYGVESPPLFVRAKIGTGQYSETAELVFASEPATNDGNALERSEEDFAFA